MLRGGGLRFGYGPDLGSFALFAAVALLLAVTFGPGIFYVAARALAGGRAEGVASSFGTGLGRRACKPVGGWLLPE